MASKAECRIRDLEILKMLSKGKTPKTVIDYCQDTYGLAPSSAYNLVYKLNAELNKSVKEIINESAEYIAKTIIGVVEDCADDGDNKTKLQALKQLSELTGADKAKDTNINVNFGFLYE